MKKKILPKNVWIVPICAVVLFFTLFLYWRAFDNTSTAPVSSISETTLEPRVIETPLTISFPNTEPRVKTPDAVEETTAVPEGTPKDSEEVTRAIDYLETLDAQNLFKEGSAAKNEATGSTKELSQDELFQLVYEGVSYHDSLVESGSVDFFLEVSNVDYPGIPRMPSGNWEGSFEFSGNRLRCTVTQNATQYDEEFGVMSLTDTTQFAYDGETFEKIQETARGRRLTRRSEVIPDASLDPRAWGWGSTDGNGALADVINRLENPHIEEVNWDGIEIYHVKGTLENIVDVELWLNPKKSYRPERHTFFVTDGAEMSKQIIRDYTYQEVAPDLWFPKSSEEIVTVTNLKTGIATDLQTRTMQFSDLRINEHIPSHRFVLDVSPGTLVFDARTRETFRVE